MAYTEDKEPLDLTALTDLADADGVVVGDASDASEAAKYITWANLKTSIGTYITGLSSYFNKSTETLDDITAGSTNKHFTSTDETKLDGIEASATADQTGAEIKSLYEAEADTNAFTDADHSKLDGIEASATGDQSDAEIETAYNNQVSQVSSGEKTAGTETAVRRFSPDDVKDMIDTHASGSGATQLSELSDVDSTVGSPSDGDIMVYRSAGTDWVLEAKPAGGSNPAMGDISDVTITSVADNEVMAYDNGTSEWINQTAAEAGLAAASHTHTTSDITDITTFGASLVDDADASAARTTLGLGDSATANKSGSDAAVISGTAGTNGNLASWNADGDLIDSTVVAADVIVDTDTATTSVAGIVELATTAEVTTGTATDKAITPDALTGSDVNIVKIDYDQAAGAVNAVGNLGATETFNWSTHTHHTGNLDSNITISFSNATSGQTITLYLTYSGAQRTITWPTTTWADNNDGSAPTAPAASGDVLIVTYFFDGTTYYGSATGNYAVYS